MFFIKRYGAPADGGGDAGGPAPSGAPSASGSNIAERIQKLQEQAGKKRKIDEVDENPKPDVVPKQAESTSSALPPNLNIHPSRLQAAPALRASQNRVKGAGKKKEKTTAKQRYLNKKKERRKAREKSKKTGGVIKPGEGKKKKNKDKSEPKEEEEGDSESSEEESDEEEKADMSLDVKESLPPKKMNKRKRVEPEEVQPDEEDASSSSDSSSSSDDEEAEEPTKLATPDADPSSISQQSLQVNAETPVTPVAEPAAPTELQPFPEPRALNALDPTLLRNQGLPQGFATPVLVDPSMTGELGAKSKTDGTENSSISCVQERTRARLQELGIQKLFAGEIGPPQLLQVIISLTSSSPQCKLL